MAIKLTAVAFVLLVVAILTIHMQMQEEEIQLTVHPSIEDIRCGQDMVNFTCSFNGDSFPIWSINSTNYSSNDINIPSKHHIYGKTLIVENITPDLDNTSYQCRRRVIKLVQGRSIPLIINSSIVHMVVRCDAPKVRIYPMYEYDRDKQLKEIKTEIALVNGSTLSHKVMFYNASDEICHSIFAPSSSCEDSFCKYTLKIQEDSHCIHNEFIKVKVVALDRETNNSLSESEMINIDIVNNVLEISPDAIITEDSKQLAVKCKFLKPKSGNEYECRIQFGIKTDGCERSSLINSAPLIATLRESDEHNSVKVGLGLEVTNNSVHIFCFIATATANEIDIASIVGVLNFSSIIGQATSNMAPLSSSTTTICWTALLAIILHDSR